MGSVAARFPVDEAAVAWRQSFLGDLPEPISAQLLAGTRVETVEPADIVLTGEDTDCILIVDGLVRLYVRGRDARQATVRYATGSEIVGLPPLLTEGMAIWGEALTTVRLLRLPAERFKALAQRDVTLAWATACYLAEQVSGTNDTLSANIFLPVRSRVARHLLDLAERSSEGLLVRARHQRIADAIGTVREVVSREMRQFADEGLVCRTADGTLLLDSAELHRIATGG